MEDGLGNGDWTAEGFTYVRGDGERIRHSSLATNTNDARRVDQIDAATEITVRVANMDRTTLLDLSLPNPADATEQYHNTGARLGLFRDPRCVCSLFLLNVQAHTLGDQSDFNPGDFFFLLEDVDMNHSDDMEFAAITSESSFDGGHDHVGNANKVKTDLSTLTRPTEHYNSV